MSRREKKVHVLVGSVALPSHSYHDIIIEKLNPQNPQNPACRGDESFIADEFEISKATTTSTMAWTTSRNKVQGETYRISRYFAIRMVKTKRN